MNLGSSSSSSLGTKLTDDIWFQIFLLLPFVSIFKLRRVSKLWSSLLSNPHFISEWIQFNGSDKLPWLVYHSYFLLDIKMRFLISYPKSLSSEFISGNEHGFSFMFLNPNPNPDNGTSIVLLDSSNGLVLCYLKPYRRAMEYYVCNPLTQQWVSLPPAPASISRFSTNEFVIRLTCKSISSTSCYKVVLIPISDTESKKFKVGVFSSDVGEWNVYEVSRPKESAGHFYGFHTLVIVSGVLYWIERGKIVAYNLNNNNSSFETGDQQCMSIDFPNLGSEDFYGTCGNNFLGQSEGLLYYAGISTSKKLLGIWVFEEDWRLLHKDFDLCDLVADIARKFCLKEAEIARKFRVKWFEWWEELEEEESAADYSHEENIAIHEMRILGFNPVDKNVILFRYKYDVWAYNIQTRRYEELASFVPKTLPPGYHFDSVYETFHRVGYRFALKAMPTIIPPPSWESSSSVNVNVHVLNLE